MGNSSPAIEVDPARLERILLNLLSNALKYSPLQSVVTVSAERCGAELCVSVCDRGPGIAPEDMPHVFERFYRSSTARQHEGLGLGLHIARALVEAHAGRITVESPPGSGAIFRVYLRAAET